MVAMIGAACDDSVAGGGVVPLPDRDAMPAPPPPDAAVPVLDAAVPMPDAMIEVDAAPAPKMNQLNIDGADALEIPAGQTVMLRVIYTDSFGEPINNGEVRIQAPAGSGLTLDANTQQTNAQGRAEIQLTAGETLGAFQVTADADFVVAPATWDVTVIDPLPGSVNVTVNYEGRYEARGIARVDVRLVEGTCAGALDNNPGGGLREVIEGPAIQPFASGDQSVIADVAAGFEFAAVAFARNATSRALAYGCTDGNTVSSGEELAVDVNLQDGRLEFKGIFEMEHILDFSLLLENAEDDGIRNFNTILEILGAIGGARGQGDNFRGDAVLILVCDRVNLPAILRPFLCDRVGLGGLTRPFVEELLHNVIEDALDADALQVFDVIGDVATIVQQALVRGQVEFIESFPNNDNILPLNENRWYGLTFSWRNGCPFADQARCQRDFDLVERVNGREAPIRGEFDAEIVEAGLMSISSHAMSLDFGLLLLAVLQGWILPDALGVQGPILLDEFVIGVLDCPTINAGLPADIPAALRDMFCENFIAVPLANILRDQIVGIEGGLDTLTIGGSVKYADDYPNLRVDRLFDGVWEGAFGEAEMLFPEFGTFSGCRDTECAQLELLDEEDAAQP